MHISFTATKDGMCASVAAKNLGISLKANFKRALKPKGLEVSDNSFVAVTDF